MKKLVAIVVALVASLAMAASAQAADETVEGTTNLTPASGSFFQAKPTAANMMIRADVSTPASSPKVNPLKNTLFKFPAGTSFNPKKSMPVCTDAKLSADSVLNDPPGVIAACKDSVVGTGVATIILAKINNNPNTVIDDPVLVLFNNGRDNKGNAKVKIWGYSKTTNYGILMSGALINGVLDVKVPVLSNDSATRYFQFDLPGPVLDREDINIKVQGLDKSYVQAVCPASGELITQSEFILGERDFATGLDVPGTEVSVASEDTVQNCTGNPGKAKLKVKVKGPKAVKKGKKGAFKVTITNNGTGIAKGVKVTATGGGKGNGGSINPGKSKTVTVKTKVTGRKGSKKKLTFTAKGGATAKASVKVKVK